MKLIHCIIFSSLIVGMLNPIPAVPDDSIDNHFDPYSMVKQTVNLFIQLDPKDIFFSAPGPHDLEDQIGRKLTDKEILLLNRDADGDWFTYSDELISFELPNDPLIKVDVFSPSDNPKLKLVGKAVSMADNSYDKVYRVTFSDNVPYILILASKKQWFDDGNCLCGPTDLMTFIHFNGNLLEFSQIPGGHINKVKVINETHRAVLFEWTHSSLTQRAYTRIGASIRLKPSSNRTTKDWISFSKEKRGFEAGLGWLRLGNTKEEVYEFLGPATEINENNLLYLNERHFTDFDGFIVDRYKLNFRNGHLTPLSADWIVSKIIDPKKAL